MTLLTWILAHLAARGVLRTQVLPTPRPGDTHSRKVWTPAERRALVEPWVEDELWRRDERAAVALLKATGYTREVQV